MTKPQAIEAARQTFAAYGVPPDATARSAELCWLELAEGGPSQPGRVRDARAWVIAFWSGKSPLIELAVEDATGKVVRDQRFA